ncbi:type 1 glutamine amidotransferase [Celerinatantimonas yamalensis]|uniref:Type 1 glutamine amidotransferase n=1 Tax=Celerinatantimonas yamalensis TaxID=559956 RepID=A0ABW9G6R7_9GAMM
MNIAIIICDHVDAPFNQQFGEYSDMFVNALNALQTDLHFVYFDALQRQLPAPDTDVDGYIITGSRHNAYDNDPWIVELVQWVRQADQHQLNVAGICFGHQLVARALGAQVKKSDKGWGLGSALVQINERPAWLSNVPETLRVWVSHQDQVTSCPPGCSVVASSDFCPYFMLAKQSHIFTVQGHPEFQQDYTQILLDRHAGQLPAHASIEQLQTSMNKPVDSEVVLRWILALFSSANTSPA